MPATGLDVTWVWDREESSPDTGVGITDDTGIWGGTPKTKEEKIQ